MPLITYPDVPDVEGVPLLRRRPDGAGADAAAASAQAYEPSGDPASEASFGQQWGIYPSGDSGGDSGGGGGSGGAPVIVPDAIVAHEIKADYEIANHPVEKGQFASYNKVAKPREVVVQMVCSGQAAGGSLSGGASDRPTFLTQLDAMVGDLNLYSIVTPDAVYDPFNLTHYDIRRTSSSGVSMLTVNCRFQQVRATAFTTFTQTARPDGQQAQSGGQQSAQPPTQSQQAALDSQAAAAYFGLSDTGGSTGQW